MGGNCERPFSATLDLVGQFAALGADSVMAPDSGAAANLICFKWPEGPKFDSGTLGRSTR